MNLDTLDKLPDSALTVVPDETPPPIPPVSSPISEVSINEVFGAGETAKTNLFNDNAGASGASGGLGNTGKPNTPMNTTLTPMKLGQTVGGKFATDLLDSILPSLMVWTISAIGYQCKKSELQLSEKEKALIAPAMQDYLNSININFNNPLYNLLFVFGTVYGAKIIDIVPRLEKKQGQKRSVTEPAKVVSIEKQKPQVVDESEKIARHLAKEKELNAFIEKLRKESKDVAIRMIIGRQSISKAAANEWYNKKVKR